MRPKVDRLCNVYAVVKPSESAINVSDERGSEHDPDDSEIPTFYDICKQCWTMFEPCKEYQYYECIEGECGEHASHGVTVNTRKTRSMLLGEVDMHVFDVSRDGNQSLTPL